MLRRSLAAAFVITLCAGLRAQTCGPNQFFLKNDNLPAVPSGPIAVTVIPGLCENEGMGAVFDVTAIGTTVQLESVAVGFFNQFGINGFNALVNLQVYDGITWSGGIPSFGPLVFDFAATTMASLQVTTHAINTADLSTYSVQINSGKMVLAWLMDFNPNGDCTNGYPSNFGTDNATQPPACCPIFCPPNACTTPTQKNLIFITGQGWRDAATVSISGFKLCPCFYAGNWVIRACVSQVTTTQTYCTAKLNSFACLPAMAWTGSPSATAGSGFTIRGTNVRNQKSGLLFYGVSGQAANPFQGGTLCVKSPIKRTPGTNSNGNPNPFQDCSGAYTIDFNAFAVGALGGTPLASLTVPGTHVDAQWWGRDPGFPAPDNTTLTDGIAFDIGP